MLRFVPLPDGCADYPFRPCLEELRYVGCICGCSVKIVALVCELEDWNSRQFWLTSWTLSSAN